MPEEEGLEQPLEGELTEEGSEEFDDSTRAVASSMVTAWGYNREAEQIEISFVNGSTHSYDCSPSQWEEAKEAVSPGRFVHQTFL